MTLRSPRPQHCRSGPLLGKSSTYLVFILECWARRHRLELGQAVARVGHIDLCSKPESECIGMTTPRAAVRQVLAADLADLIY